MQRMQVRSSSGFIWRNKIKRNRGKVKNMFLPVLNWFFLKLTPGPSLFAERSAVRKLFFLPLRNPKSAIWLFLSPVFLHLARTGIISKTPGLIEFNLDNTAGNTISPGVAKHTGERIFQRKIRRGIRIIPKREARVRYAEAWYFYSKHPLVSPEGMFGLNTPLSTCVGNWHPIPEIGSSSPESRQR